MNVFKSVILTLSICLGGALALPATAGAIDVINGSACSGGGASNPLCTSKDTAQNDLNSQIRNVTNVIMFLLGAVSVIVIIIGGMMYVVSAGDPGRAKKAKDTILYAVVGLVIALFAGAIVNFVVRNVG